jgi:hypothetical protein
MSTDFGSVFGGVKNALGKDQNQAALLKSGFDLFGSILAGKGAEGQYREQANRSDARDLRDRSFGLDDRELNQQNANFGLRQAQQDGADQTVLNSMGRSPLEFAGERGRMSALADVLGRGSPANLGVHGGPFAGGLSPETVAHYRPSAAKEEPYWNAVAQASKGRFQGPGLGASYGDEGAEADSRVGGVTAASGADFEKGWSDHLGAVQDLQSQARTNVTDREAALQTEAEKKKGGGFGGFLLNTVAPIGLGLATGGMAPLAQIALQAALGGAKGGLSGGGIKGALKGAAGGAAIGGSGAALRGLKLPPKMQTDTLAPILMGSVPLGKIPPQPVFRGDALGPGLART